MIGSFFSFLLTFFRIKITTHRSASIFIHTQHTTHTFASAPHNSSHTHTKQNTTHTHTHVVDEWRQQKTYIHHSQDQLTFVLGTIRFKFFALRRATQGSGMYYTPFGVLIFGGEKVQETQWEKER